MVKEIILKVGTGEAVKNVGELRENIKQLKKALNDQDLSNPEGMQKYNELLGELKINQNALKDAMYATTASWEDITNAATGANIAFDQNNKLVNMEGVSYNALVHELADLKQAWRVTTDEMERAALGERINSVNDQLKSMDASVGNYQRNVGNYIGAVDHLTASFGSMGKGAQSIIAPIKGVTMGLKTMSATPVVGILGLLASVLNQIIGSLKSSEENTNAMTAAMAPFAAIGDVVTKILQGLGGVLVKVVEGFGKLTSAIFGSNEATKERLRLAQEEAALQQKERDNIIKNAEAEREVARLRAEASDKTNHDAKERIALLEEAGNQERQIAERAMEAARMQYEIVKAKNALTKSSAEDLKKEAEAYAALVNAETNYYKKVREINAGITEARNAEAKAAKDAAKAVRDAATAKINAEKDYLSQLLDIVKDGSESQFKIQNTIAKKEYELAVANAKQKITDQAELNRTLEMLEKAFHVRLQKNQQDHDNKVLAEEVQAATNRAEAFRHGSAEYLEAMRDVAALEYDEMKRQMDETDAEWQARRLAAARKLAEAQQSTTDALIEEGRLALENEMNALATGSLDQLSKAVELAKYNVDNLHQAIDESDDAFLARRLEAQQAYREALQAQNEAEVEEGRQQYEQRLATLEEDSLAYLDAEVDLKKYELDTLHQLEGESEEAFRTRQLQAEKEYYKAKKAQVKSWMQTLTGMASGVSSILGSIADAMEENTEMTEEEAQKAKNLRIAAATIDMLQGAVTAYAGAQSLGVPMGPIIGAINAAAVVAAGIANIAKIKATQVSKDSSTTQTPSVPAQVNAPTVSPQVQQVRTLTSASEEDRLNRMADDHRVYILSSDLEADRDQHRVQVEETTF